MLRPHLQLVVLHPYQFLPDDLSITRRRLADPVTNISYIITNDERLRATDDPSHVTAPEFPIEQQQTRRTTDQCLNVWLLLLNAASKFRFFQKRYGMDVLPPDILEVVNLTLEIVDLLYAQPIATTEFGKAALAGSQSFPPKHTSRDSNEDGDDDQGHNGVRHDVGTSKEGHNDNVGNVGEESSLFQGKCRCFPPSQGVVK